MGVVHASCRGLTHHHHSAVTNNTNNTGYCAIAMITMIPVITIIIKLLVFILPRGLPVRIQDPASTACWIQGGGS